MSEDVWPEYNLHGDLHEDWWGPLLQELPEYQFALYDDTTDVVLAEAHTGPLAWDGDDRSLPDGIDDALTRIVAARRAGTPVDTLCAMAAEVSPGARRRGLAAEVLRAMRELAGRQSAPPAGGSRPALVEGPVPARADRALHHLASRGRPAARSLDARA